MMLYKNNMIIFAVLKYTEFSQNSYVKWEMNILCFIWEQYRDLVAISEKHVLTAVPWMCEPPWH